MEQRLYKRREISASEVLDLTWSDAYAIERKIQEDLDSYER